jgi:two-component system chemotaxis sensor kinase CheA
MADVQDLARQVSEIQFVSPVAVAPVVLEQRLGLPTSFHSILTPDRVRKAVAALNEKKRFYVVRADLNADEKLAAAFAGWLAGDVVTAIGNVSVLTKGGTEFDFLIATPLDQGALEQTLADFDPSGARLRIERKLSDSAAG